MARKVKCPKCNKLNDKERAKQISNRYYCITCAEEREKEIERNKDSWELLFDYICDLYNISTLTGMMFKQIKDFRDNYNYKNMGMYLTLKYYYEILENEVKEDTGLGIIPYYYERAKKHFLEVKDVENYLEDFEFSESPKIIKIKNKNSYKNDKRYKQLSFD